MIPVLTSPHRIGSRRRSARSSSKARCIQFLQFSVWLPPRFHGAYVVWNSLHNKKLWIYQYDNFQLPNTMQKIHNKKMGGGGGRREAGTTTYIRMNKIVKNKITRYLIIFSKLRSKQYRLYLTYVTSNGFNIILGIYRFENGFNNTIWTDGCVPKSSNSAMFRSSLILNLNIDGSVFHIFVLV